MTKQDFAAAKAAANAIPAEVKVLADPVNGVQTIRVDNRLMAATGLRTPCPNGWVSGNRAAYIYEGDIFLLVRTTTAS
ncbi:hypothetical protein ACFZAM_31205 [Streptomyces sp. NPDC008079]|uniref:hypothetical protein n=1 Tax=Streptomyces sp. NPDC008079 TaxID=3364806 RepID=UPI0036F07D09